MLRASSAKKSFILILVFLVSTDLAIVSDTPILRQFLGFIFFSIVPGLLILHILKLGRLGLAEKAVLSVGLSTSFLIFFGLIINSAYPLLGYDTPLSTASVTISFSLATLVLAVVAYLRNRTTTFFSRFDFKLDFKEKSFLAVPALFLLMSILGMNLMNATGNNTVLMALLFLVSAYVIFIAVMHDRVPDRTYPAIVLLTSASLLLLITLRCPHILGSDAHYEYYLFQLTDNAQHWQIVGSFENLNACLAISLRPAIFQSFLNMDPESLFKLLHFFLAVFSPLVVFIISRKYIGSSWAFLAACFFMAQPRFFLFGGGRNDIAILFFLLTIMVLVHQRLGGFNRNLLFIVLGATCIVSHYAATYFFLLVLLFAWIAIQIARGIIFLRKKPLTLGNPLSHNATLDPSSRDRTSSPPLPRPKGHITIATVAVFFGMLYFWYSQIVSVVFYHGVDFFSDVYYASISQFLNLEARATASTAALGVGLGDKGIPQRIEFVFAWLTVAFIVFGVLITLARHRHVVALPGEETQPFESRNPRIDAEFLALAVGCCAIMVLAAVLPRGTRNYDMGRVFAQMMAVLAPFCVIGGIALGRFLRARSAYLIVLLVLVPYFLCTSGAIYELSHLPRNMVLNTTSDYYDWFYVHDQESYALKWIKENGDGTTVYADHLGSLRLVSQSGVPRPPMDERLVYLYLDNKEIDGYIYLRYQTVVKGEILGPGYEVHSLAEYPDMLAKKNKIYASNGSEIHR